MQTERIPCGFILSAYTLRKFDAILCNTVLFNPFFKQMPHPRGRHIQIDGLAISNGRPPNKLQHLRQRIRIFVNCYTCLYKKVFDNRVQIAVNWVGDTIPVSVLVSRPDITGDKTLAVTATFYFVMVAFEYRPQDLIGLRPTNIPREV